MGAYINCYVGLTPKTFSDILGPYGINNINIKGIELLYLYKTNNLKILLSYFKHNNYITYISFNDKKSTHMLDNFVCCNQLFKMISDCKVTKLRVRSNHTVFVKIIRLTSIRFNNEQQESTVIDWEKIITEEEKKYIFNDDLYELMEHGKFLSNYYTTFNSAILLDA